MDLSLAEAASRVGLDTGSLSRALASFVRSLLYGNSPYDHFAAGNREALTPQQRLGLEVFRGKGNCTACHVGPNFSDESMHNTGIAWKDGRAADDGGGQGRFKTPTLREIRRTAPYMHDGSIGTLEEVIDYYDRGGNRNSALDAEIRPLRLSLAERQALAAFLSALSSKEE